MHIAVVASRGRSCLLSEFSGDGTGHGRIVTHDDLCTAVAERERTGDVRWVWAACGDVYPALLREIFDPPITLYVKGAWSECLLSGGSGLATR